MENFMVISWGFYGDFMEILMMHWGLFLGDFLQGFDGEKSHGAFIGGLVTQK